MEKSIRPLPGETTQASSRRRVSRRAFCVTAAGVLGAGALWSFRWLPVSIAEASDDGSGFVTVIQFSADGKRTGQIRVPHVAKSNAEWRKQLSPISYNVTREAGTERPYTGDSWNLHERGIFRCICCDLALFSSETKFDSGTGWPSFWQPIAKENIVETSDTSFGMSRTAVSCRECDAHIGHVFHDGPPPTGLRYCMNSAAMRFVKLA